MDPLNIEAWYQRGIIFYRVKKYYEAINSLNKVIDIDFQHEKAFNCRNSIYKELGNYNKLIKEFELESEDKPDYAVAWYYHKGLNLIKIGKNNDIEKNTKKFIYYFKKAIQINPNNHFAWYYKGLTHLNISHQYEEALKAF
ncbi:MAG: tetratricopeptide repeat protein [Methanosarcinaceae archaeon]